MHRRYPLKDKRESTCGIVSRVIDKATPRMGYTRIEHIPGRPLAFVASLNEIQRQGAEWGE